MSYHFAESVYYDCHDLASTFGWNIRNACTILQKVPLGRVVEVAGTRLLPESELKHLRANYALKRISTTRREVIPTSLEVLCRRYDRDEETLRALLDELKIDVYLGPVGQYGNLKPFIRFHSLVDILVPHLWTEAFELVENSVEGRA